jgi:hypothetical protein
MTDAAAMSSALDEYRQMLKPDDADLELVGVQDGTVSVRLRLGAEACAECVLPREMLETLLLDGLRRHDGAITAVVVDDPRPA